MLNIGVTSPPPVAASIPSEKPRLVPSVQLRSVVEGGMKVLKFKEPSILLTKGSKMICSLLLGSWVYQPYWMLVPEQVVVPCQHTGSLVIEAVPVVPLTERVSVNVCC